MNTTSSGPSRRFFDEFMKCTDALPIIRAWECLCHSLSIVPQTLLELPSGSKAETTTTVSTPSGQPVDYSFEIFKERVTPHLAYKQNNVLQTLTQKWKECSPYREKISASRDSKYHLIISGGGPCGLRAAVEAKLVGLSVTLIELRLECSRHNILKLWQNTLDDLIKMGAMLFVPGLQAHGHLHIPTKDLQIFLLKIGLFYGIRYVYGRGVCGFLRNKREESEVAEWKIWTLPHEQARVYLGRPEAEAEVLSVQPGEQNTDKLNQLNKVDFYEKPIADARVVLNSEVEREEEWKDFGDKVLTFGLDGLMVAEGESSRMLRRLGFDRKISKYNEAIGIVVNLKFGRNVGGKEKQLKDFVVWRAAADWKEGPLGKLSDMGIELENLEYMKGSETHFLAATTRQKMLLDVGVIKEIKATVRDTLTKENVSVEALKKFGRKLAQVGGLTEDVPFADKNAVQVFDFSCKGVCVNPLRWLEDELLVVPAGDALQNPYWPQGLGINRGFHNALDGVWTFYVNVVQGAIDESITEAPELTNRDRVEEERKFAFKWMDWKTFSPLSLTPGKNWEVDPKSRYSLELLKDIKKGESLKATERSEIPPRLLKLLPPPSNSSVSSTTTTQTQNFNIF